MVQFQFWAKWTSWNLHQFLNSQKLVLSWPLYDHKITQLQCNSKIVRYIKPFYSPQIVYQESNWPHLCRTRSHFQMEFPNFYRSFYTRTWHGQSAYVRSSVKNLLMSYPNKRYQLAEFLPRGFSSNRIEKSKMIFLNNPLWSYIGQPWVTVVNRGQPWLFRSRICWLPVTIRLRWVMLNLLYQEDYGLLNGERNEVKKGMRQKRDWSQRWKITYFTNYAFSNVSKCRLIHIKIFLLILICLFSQDSQVWATLWRDF